MINNIKEFDSVLELLYNHSDYIDSHDLRKSINKNITNSEMRRIIDYLYDNKYIDKKILKISNNNSINPRYLCKITQSGWELYDQGGFISIVNEEKRLKKVEEIIDFEKAKTDLEIAKKVLKEYPKTKWIARIAFIIGVILSILKLKELLL